VSDEDFFFDEDDERPSEQAEQADDGEQQADDGEQPATSSIPETESTSSQPSAEPHGVSMTIALLLAVIALLTGIVIGLLINTRVAPSGAGSSKVDLNNIAIPPLSQDQMNSGMPSDHPDVNGGSATGGSSASGTGQ
jgi:hypothetical protein